jgi:hypothetical protein
MCFLATIALVLCGSAWASDHPEHPKAHAKAELDGKVFVGTMGKAGETEGDKDQLIFKKGTFVSTACVPMGFHDAPYTVTEKDGVVTFTSSPKNADGETMSWTGTVRDGALEATAVHSAGSGETTYWFKGKLGSAEAAAEAPEHPKKSEHPDHPK